MNSTKMIILGSLIFFILFSITSKVKAAEQTRDVKSGEVIEESKSVESHLPEEVKSGSGPEPREVVMTVAKIMGMVYFIGTIIVLVVCLVALVSLWL